MLMFYLTLNFLYGAYHPATMFYIPIKVVMVKRLMCKYVRIKDFLINVSMDLFASLVGSQSKPV